MPAAPGTPPIAVPPGPRESREYLSATPSGPRIKCGVTCRDSPTPGHSALRRGIQGMPGRGIPPAAPVWTPHQVRGDTQRLSNTGSFRTRCGIQGIPGQEYHRRHPSGPRIKCGVTRFVIPRPDAESRKYPGRNTHKRHSSGPRIKCGVTLLVLYYHAEGEVEHVYSILKKYKFAFISRI